jgi:membrane-bound ClpP family serine protease
LAAPRPASTLPVVVEVIAGLFGLFGIGWLMSGFTSTGLFLLIGGIIWDVVGSIIGVVTLGIGFLCLGIVNVIVLISSAVILNRRLTTGR